MTEGVRDPFLRDPRRAAMPLTGEWIGRGRLGG